MKYIKHYIIERPSQKHEYYMPSDKECTREIPSRKISDLVLSSTDIEEIELYDIEIEIGDIEGRLYRIPSQPLNRQCYKIGSFLPLKTIQRIDPTLYKILVKEKAIGMRMIKSGTMYPVYTNEERANLINISAVKYKEEENS